MPTPSQTGDEEVIPNDAIFGGKEIERALATPMLRRLCELIRLRNAHPALRTGTFRTVLTDDAQDVWVFLREGNGEQVLVALNAAAKPATITVARELVTGQPA